LIFGEKSQDGKRDFGIDIKQQLSDLFQLRRLHEVWDVERKDLQNKTPFYDLFRKLKDVSVKTTRQPLVVRSVVSLDVEPEGVNPGLL